jgi:hypothetical protein
MTTHTATSRGNGADYHYYLCKQRKERRQACDCEQRAVRAAEAEGRVWAFVAGLLRNPERVRRGVERLVEEERTPPARDPEREAGEWAERIAACDRRRGAYQDQQAAGLMTLEELGSKLRDLDNTRRVAERELASLKDRRKRAEGIEKDRDALLESMAEMVPEALDSLTGEEKNRVYRMLRLEVAPHPEDTTSAAPFVLAQPRQDEVEPELELGFTVHLAEPISKHRDVGKLFCRQGRCPRPAAARLHGETPDLGHRVPRRVTG